MNGNWAKGWPVADWVHLARALSSDTRFGSGDVVVSFAFSRIR
jgi:hypothetical protein